MVTEENLNSNKAYTFEHILKLVEEKECKVLSLKEDYKNTKTRIKIKLKCGHEYTTTYNQFMRKCIYDCKECIDKSMILNNYNHELNVSTSSIIEGDIIYKLKEKLKNYFDVEKNKEACLADLLIKPKDVSENNWIAIQLKTNNSNNVYQYGFRKINLYPNMLIICIYIQTFNIWIFNGSDLTKIKVLTIGKTNSKYSRFEIKEDDLINTLKIAYETGKYNNIDIIKSTIENIEIPIGEPNKIEHAHRIKRELVLKKIYTIKYPIYDNSKTDCLINNLRIQDKSLRKRNDCSDWYITTIPSNHYKKNDNDFYWLYTQCSNYKDKFLVLSIKVLEDANLFTEDGYLKTISLSLKRDHKFHKYMFDYTNIDFDRLKQILI